MRRRAMAADETTGQHLDSTMADAKEILMPEGNAQVHAVVFSPVGCMLFFHSSFKHWMLFATRHVKPMQYDLYETSFQFDISV